MCAIMRKEVSYDARRNTNDISPEFTAARVETCERTVQKWCDPDKVSCEELVESTSASPLARASVGFWVTKLFRARVKVGTEELAIAQA